MENKYIILILLAVIIIISIGIGVSLFSQSTVEYETIKISNGTTIDVPKANDAEWKELGYGIKTYTCPSKRVVLTSFNSAENAGLVGAGGFAVARDALLSGASAVENYNNCEIKENTVNGTHYYMAVVGNNTTHDNIMIGASDLEILKHMLDSIRYGAPKVVQANVTDEATEAAPVEDTNTTNTNNNANDPNKYTEEDLRKASQAGYDAGFLDGYGTSFDESYDDLEDVNTQSTTDSSSQSSSSSNVVTTTDDTSY